MDKQIIKKLGNTAQCVSVRKMTYADGSTEGDSVLLAVNGGMELTVSVSHCLDILQARHNGVNLSFLSKNGINRNSGAFANKFEGGMLYTCGVDNIGVPRNGNPMHGSIHSVAAENVVYRTEGDSIVIEGDVFHTALFGSNMVLHRKWVITGNSFSLRDTLENRGYRPENYVLLYHCNFGYPMLDACTTVASDAKSLRGVTEKAERNKATAFVMSEAINNEEEEVFYHIDGTGRVVVNNPKLGKRAIVSYDSAAMPNLVQWKSMASGDYALGIEPSTSKFNDEFAYSVIESQQSKQFSLTIEIL